MGSRVFKRMDAIGKELQGRTLTDSQKTVVDVFSGKANNISFVAKRMDGEKTIMMRQGNKAI